MVDGYQLFVIVLFTAIVVGFFSCVLTVLAGAASRCGGCMEYERKLNKLTSRKEYYQQLSRDRTVL